MQTINMPSVMQSDDISAASVPNKLCLVAQKSTLHRSRGSFSTSPRLSNGARIGSSLASLQPRLTLKPLPFHSSLALAARSPFDGGRRILASTSGAETKRELSSARGETVSWRQLSEERSEELRGARSRRGKVRGAGRESDD